MRTLSCNVAATWLATIVLLVAVVQADEEPTIAATTEEVPPPTIDPNHPLSAKVGERQVSSIEVKWEEPKEGEPEYYIIKTYKADSKDTIETEQLVDIFEYVVENLMVNSDYKLCIHAYSKNDEVTEPDCLETSTIPIIRWDSLVYLFAAVGYIIFMILLGIGCWYCTKRRIEKDNEESESEEEPEANEERPAEEEKIAPTVFQPAYVSQASGAPERSSIGDNPDIPYITPPVGDQMKKTPIV